jgi:hypothetical protein
VSPCLKENVTTPMPATIEDVSFLFLKLFASLRKFISVALWAQSCLLLTMCPAASAQVTSAPGDQIETLVFTGTATCAAQPGVTNANATCSGSGPITGTYSLDLTTKTIVGSFSFSTPFGGVDDLTAAPVIISGLSSPFYGCGSNPYTYGPSNVSGSIYVEFGNQSYIEYPCTVIETYSINFFFPAADTEEIGALASGNACYESGQNGYAVCDLYYNITGTFAVGAPAPVILGQNPLSPGSVTAEGPAFTLKVNGSGFVNGSVVEFNGTAVPTSYVSANQLSASISAALIASYGDVGITVLTPGIIASNTVAFAILPPPPPTIASINPSSATAGSPSLTVTITGSGFVSGAVAEWNALSLSTNLVSATTLTATIPASDLVSAGTGEINVQNPSGLLSNSLPFLVSSISAQQLRTVAPCRVLDTRTPANGSIYAAGSPFGSPYIAAGTVRTIPIPASTNCPGVPANAAAYSLNLTVQPRTPNQGYLTVWPTGMAQPNVSAVSFSNPAVVLAAAGIVPAGANGAINATGTQDLDLIVDINGYFVPPTTGTLQFYPLAPCRVLDTRTPANSGSFPANSTFGSPALDGVHARSFPIPSSTCGAPANAAAYSFNVGVVPSGALYFLAAYPTGGTLPVVSTMNSFDGTTLANAAIVPAGPGGAVNFFASNPTDFFVDINGYFAPPGSGGLNLYTVPPCRLVDTRNADSTFGGPTFNTDTSRSFPLPESSCGIPGEPAVAAYSLSITVYPVGGGLYYLTTWPTGQPQPFASTLNAIKPLLPIANAALVPAGTGGAISVFTTNPTDVTIDTAGYFGP